MLTVLQLLHILVAAAQTVSACFGLVFAARLYVVEHQRYWLHAFLALPIRPCSYILQS